MARETSASQLFDVLAGCVGELVEENNEKELLKKKAAKLGFTFSFPCAQRVRSCVYTPDALGCTRTSRET